MKLETGMIVESRINRRGILLNGIIYWESSGFMEVSDYNKDLKPISKLFSTCSDIMKVYNLKEIYDIRKMFLDESLELIWQRKEYDITNPNEIEILQALLKLGLNFIAKDKNGKLYAYQNEPTYDKDFNCWLEQRWLYQSKSNDYSNVIKIEKGFEWISCGSLLNVKETLDDNL